MIIIMIKTFKDYKDNFSWKLKKKKKTNNNTVNHCIVKERIVLFGPAVAIFIQQIVLDHIPHLRYRL